MTTLSTVMLLVSVPLLFFTMSKGMSYRIDVLVDEYSACQMMGGTPIATNKGYSCYLEDKKPLSETHD